MFAPFITRSKSLDLIEAESSEDGVAHKVTFRVLDARAWGLQLVEMLQFADDEDDYVISVRKEYYLQDGHPTFVWNMMIWGDCAAAAQDLGPLLLVMPPEARGKHHVVQEVLPPHAAPAEGRAILDVRRLSSDNGSTAVVKRVRLPHRRGNRDNPGNITKKLGDRKLGAYVTTVAHGE